MLLLGLSLRKKCESQLVHRSIYTFDRTDHSPAPLAARVAAIFAPERKSFPSSRRTLIIICTVVMVYNMYKNTKCKKGPVTHPFVIQRLQVYIFRVLRIYVG